MYYTIITKSYGMWVGNYNYNEENQIALGFSSTSTLIQSVALGK